MPFFLLLNGSLAKDFRPDKRGNVSDPGGRMEGVTSRAVEEHRHHAPRRVRCAVITVSDTRTEATDEGGRTVREELERAGHEVARRAIVPDEPGAIRAALDAALASDAGIDAVILTGGTGIAPRDVTYEVVSAVIEKRLDGFGELFRRLSFDEVGPAAMLSRAVAGVARGRVVAALPGSPAACKLAVERLLAPELGHMVGLLRR
jgi:molybdenum cofactor biosynthesis protein B